MKASKWVVAVCTSCLLPALAVAGESTSFDSATLRIAVQKGLGLLVKTSPNFIKRGGCNSCHNQFLPAMAQAVARKRGIDAGPDIAQMEGMQMDFSPERARVHRDRGRQQHRLFDAERRGEEAAGRRRDRRVRPL